MKQEFEILQEDFDAIMDIARDRTPVIYVGVWLGLDKQERANKIWQVMADNYGFIWDTVEPSAKGQKFFLAVPKPKVIPKTAIEIAMDEYDSLQKIVDQLESCEYENQAGILNNNIAFLKLKQFAKEEF
jgi:hypothetical protein